MQMLLDMWNASPGGVILFSIPILIFAGFVIGFVLSTAVDVLQMLINGVVRVFRGHPPVASQAYPIAVDDDEDEDYPGIGMTDRQMQCLADRLVGEIVPKALIEVSRHADLLDRLALKIADRQNELNADATADDALVAKIADAVRDRVNEVTVSATDLDLFAAKVMELADQRRAERERAKAEQAATLEGFQVVESAMPKDGEYKRDDLVEVLVEGEWKPGWYAGYFKNDPDDETPHYVAYIEYQDPDGGTDVVDDYIADRDIRHRQPVTTPATA